jgi:5-methylcytosine-specific restriction endonuclease McrA
MISIRLKDIDNPPERLVCPAAVRQLKRAANERSGAVCSGNYYRDNSVRNLLKAYSIGKRVLDKKDKPKCFYCESQGEAMLPLEVEHYRPKDGLNKIDLIAGQVHVGYYWLGNEWSNLILSCRSCNNSGAKGTRFPIGNNQDRVFHHQPVDNSETLNRDNCKIDSQDLLNESPILLNPEIDTPEEHLTFDNTGQIIHKPGKIRGKKTIEILQLYRDPLLIERQDILEDFRNDINVLVGLRTKDKISNAVLKEILTTICWKIISRKEPNTAYTLWGRFINDNIEELIVSKIHIAYQQIFKESYQHALDNPL